MGSSLPDQHTSSAQDRTRGDASRDSFRAVAGRSPERLATQHAPVATLATWSPPTWTAHRVTPTSHDVSYYVSVYVAHEHFHALCVLVGYALIYIYIYTSKVDCSFIYTSFFFFQNLLLALEPLKQKVNENPYHDDFLWRLLPLHEHGPEVHPTLHCKGKTKVSLTSCFKQQRQQERIPRPPPHHL